MIKRRGAPRLTNHFSDCSVSSGVVVMVQWLAHLTGNPGNAGSIPTHGVCVFHAKWSSQYYVLASDYIVGFPVLHYSGPVGARVIKDVRFQFFFSCAAKCTLEKRGRV